MNHNDWDECFVLHQRSHGETSLIAEIFSKKNGKMSVIAKGAKKPKSKFFGYLALFTKLKVTYSGRSELKTLTNVDRDFSKTSNSFSKTSYSLLYINELLIDKAAAVCVMDIHNGDIVSLVSSPPNGIT